MFRLLRRFFPLGRVGIALWAWQNRDQIREWLRFGQRSTGRLRSGQSADVVAEARLRASLTRVGQSRPIAGVAVDVRDGVATLTGPVDPETHADLLALAKRTPGVKRVEDRLTVAGRRGLFR